MNANDTVLTQLTYQSETSKRCDPKHEKGDEVCPQKGDEVCPKKATHHQLKYGAETVMRPEHSYLVPKQHTSDQALLQRK